MDDSRAHDLIVKGHLMDIAFENRRKEGEYAVKRDKGKLPGLNEYLKAERSFCRGHSCGNDMKRDADVVGLPGAIRESAKREEIKPVRCNGIQSRA